VITDLLTLLTTASAKVDNRVYPTLAEQQAPRPLIVYQRISDVPQGSMEPATLVRQAVVQFDVYAATRAKAEEVADAIEADLGNYVGTVNDTRFDGISIDNVQDLDTREGDGSDRVVYRTSIDVRVRYAR
jgi:hypothetical protein